MIQQILPYIVIIGIPFWLWMLTDAALREHKKKHHTHVWTFFIAITFIIGALVYLFVVKLKKK